MKVRRGLLAMGRCLPWLVALPGIIGAAPLMPPAEWLVGGDISALPKLESLGAVFKHAEGGPADALRLLRENGATCFRLRLFVEPTGRGGVVNDLSYTMQLAKRVKASGAALMLDFHYSDTWADPGHQQVPRSWTNLTGKALEQKVEEYSTASLRELARAGAFPELVQIGNEINHGLLWPHGKLSGTEGGGWEQLAALLKAGVRGVRAATPPGQRVRVIMHTATGGLTGRTRWFAEKLREHGVEYDVLGLSYYPWWHGTLAGLREDVRQVAAEFGKEVMVVETGYPWRQPSPGSKLREGIREWPPTPEGQERFLRDVMAAVAAAPSGRGLGVLWWYPESIRVKGMPGYFGGDTAWFDSQGQALPALRALPRSASNVNRTGGQ